MSDHAAPTPLIAVVLSGALANDQLHKSTWPFLPHAEIRTPRHAARPKLEESTIYVVGHGTDALLVKQDIQRSHAQSCFGRCATDRERFIRGKIAW